MAFAGVPHVSASRSDYALRASPCLPSSASSRQSIPQCFTAMLRGQGPAYREAAQGENSTGRRGVFRASLLPRRYLEVICRRHPALGPDPDPLPLMHPVPPLMSRYQVSQLTDLGVTRTGDCGPTLSLTDNGGSAHVPLYRAEARGHPAVAPTRKSPRPRLGPLGDETGSLTASELRCAPI